MLCLGFIAAFGRLKILFGMLLTNGGKKEIIIVRTKMMLVMIMNERFDGEFGLEGAGNLLSVTGTIDGVIYQNGENGYSICELESEDGDSVIVVGTMPYVSEGEKITAYGEWCNHAKYGRQFKIEYYEKMLPVEENDILKYLSSSAVKGIKSKTAMKIVERFGQDTFEVIEMHPDWLTEISGITPKKAAQISENFREKAGARSVMMFCRDFFSPATAMKVYKKWGGAAVDIISNNPYKLCEDFNGIGFKRADKIAFQIGIKNDSPDRISGGIRHYIFSAASQNGHTCILYGDVVRGAAELLEIDYRKISDAIESMVGSGELYLAERDGAVYVYLGYYYKAEKYTASKLSLIDQVCPRIGGEDTERFINQIEALGGIKYAALQRKAIVGALESGVMILTGGPGTGKTTVIRALIRIFDDMGFETALAAPTGRAAKRMSEATSMEAKTIHRLLEMEFNNDVSPRFARDESNLLEEDVIIIDEASMIDIILASSLLKAIKPGARLILIGDAQQLPSVGAGNVLHDIIDSGKFNTVCLTEIFRQSKESMIITNAHAINSGIYPRLDIKNSDFFYLPRERDADIARTIADLCKNRLPKSYGADIVNKIQVITPSRKGEAGTDMLNKTLQAEMNPESSKKNEKRSRDIIFREGDRVMQIRNNYSIEWEKDDKYGVGIFNGDIGTIEIINLADDVMTINFDDRRVMYDFTNLDDLDHAFAITVHKSQGSEYPVVIIPMYSCPSILLTRNLLYTAVTRAQEMVIIVGRAAVLHTMVDNNRQIIRNTGLREMIVTH